MAEGSKALRDDMQGHHIGSAQLTTKQSLSAQLAEWHALWQDSQQQHVSAPECGARNRLPHTECYHVAVKGLFLTAKAQSQLTRAGSINHHPRGKQLRAIATLYDGHSSCLFGSQCMSMPVWFPAPGAMLDDGFLDIGLDIFWHSQIADPKVSMLIQLTLASRDESGALVDEFCLAWSRLPLSKDLVVQRLITEGSHKGSVEAPVHKGTCYYVILAETAYRDTAAALPPPLLIEGCHLVYTVQRSPQLGSAVPYLKQDQLVTHSSFIPGLVRLGPHSNNASAFANQTTGRSLKVPIQCSMHSVKIPHLAITLHSNLYQALSGSCSPADLHVLLDHLEAAVPAAAAIPVEWADGQGQQCSHPTHAAEPNGDSQVMPSNGSTPDSASGARTSKQGQRGRRGSTVQTGSKKGKSGAADSVLNKPAPSASPKTRARPRGTKVEKWDSTQATHGASAPPHGLESGDGHRQTRGRSTSPWRKGWFSKRTSSRNQPLAQDTAEAVDITILVHSLRHHDVDAIIAEQHRVFAEIGTRWHPGLVLQAEPGAGPQQHLQVQVAGDVHQLLRQDVVLQLPNMEQDGTQPAPLTISAATAEETVRSLRADSGAGALIEDQAVFAKVQGKWEPGLIVRCPADSGVQAYSVLVEDAVLELQRDHVGARLASSTVHSQQSPMPTPEPADAALLQKSLKQKDAARAVLPDEPVFVRLNGTWRPAVVGGVHANAQARPSYYIHVAGVGGGVFDFERDDICHQAQADGVSEKKKISGIFSRFMQPRQRGSSTPGPSPADDTDLPSAAAVLQEPAGSLGSHASNPKKAVPQSPGATGLTAQAPHASESEMGTQQEETPEINPEGAGRERGAVAEGRDASGHCSDDSSTGSSWSSGSPKQLGLEQRPLCRASHSCSPAAEAAEHSCGPRLHSQHISQVSASLKDLLRARKEQELHLMHSGPVAESQEVPEPDGSGAHESSAPARGDAMYDGRPDIVRLRALLADADHYSSEVCQQSSLAVCVSVHNGIQTVGREVWFPRATVWAPDGSSSTTVLCPDAVTIDWVPEDVCCNILIELRLLASPIARVTDEPHVTQLLRDSERIGWAVVPPFASILSTGVTLNTATQMFPMQSSPGLDPRGACMSSCQDIIAGECLHHGMLTNEVGALLQALNDGIDMEPLVRVLIGIQEGADPQSPDPVVQLAPQETDVDADDTESDQDCREEPAAVAVSRRAQTSTAVARSGPEQPVLLQQMLAMSRQQEALQEQSRHVQELLQQMRQEQTTLATRLEDIRKEKHDRTVAEGTWQAAGAAAPLSPESGTVVRVANPNLGDLDQDAAARHTHVAQQDLRALQLLQHNGGHVTDDVFRGTPEQHCSADESRQGITRAEAALLHQAGGGQSLLPTLAMPTVVALDTEVADPNTVNSIMIQFLSMTPASSLNAPRKMQKCFMRFQFYDFRPTETPVYILNPVQHMSAATARTYNRTCLLQPVSGQAQVLKYIVDGLHDSVLMQQVDGSNALPNTAACLRAKHTNFAEHLAQRCLSVDLFDAESSLHVGTASIPLRGLLRQGRQHTECVLKVTVLDPFESLTVQQAGMAQRAAAFMPERHDGVSSAHRGVLQVRLINIGSKHATQDVVGPVGERTRSGVKSRSVRSVALLETDADLVTELIPSWHQPRDENSGRRAGGSPQPLVLTEPPHAASADVLERRLWDLQQLRQVLRQVGGRKVQLEALVSQPRGGSAQQPMQKVHEVDVQERLVADATAIRERHKREFVTKELRSSRVQRHKLMAEYGKAMILDFIEFFNPSGEAQTFRVVIDAPNIVRPINSQAELKSLCHSMGCGSNSDFHFAEQEALAGDMLHLRPQELLRVPFLLQVFKGPSAGPLPMAVPNSAAGGAVEASHHASPDALRTVNVKLVQRMTGDEVLVHRITVVMRRPVIDRTFRFYAPRNDFLRETVKLDALPGREHTLYAAGVDLRELVAVGSHAHVILTTKASSPGHGAKDRVTIKAKSHARSTQSETFNITLYATSSRVKPLEFWQVHVHWLNTHEMTAVIGQSNRTSVLLRGLPGASRNVALFCSHPDELQVEPTRLRLPAAMQVEVKLLFHPLATGTLNMIVTVIDVDSGGLVDALLIGTHARAPHVSRTFEVDLPVGTIVNKKVGYRNMYHQRKKFILGTSNPRLIKFSHRELEVPAEDQRNIGIQVNSTNESPGLKDVLIFINDEDNRNEECYKVRVHVYQPDV